MTIAVGFSVTGIAKVKKKVTTIVVAFFFGYCYKSKKR